MLARVTSHACFRSFGRAPLDGMASGYLSSSELGVTWAPEMTGEVK
jgi:hypothetical protein